MKLATFGFLSLCAKSIDFLYPPLCLHCSHALESGWRLLCPSCLSLLTLLDPSSRCPSCFLEREGEGPCSECYRFPFPFHASASFSYEGPAKTLVHHMKFRQAPYLAKGAAAYMALQWERMQWPAPDGVVPIPTSLSRWIYRGYNQSLEIARALCQLFRWPLLSILSRKEGGYSQRWLNQEERKRRLLEEFLCIQKINLRGRRLLLIDDVFTTGATLEACAKQLWKRGANAIYVLTFCRTERE